MKTKEERTAKNVYNNIAESYHNHRTKLYPKGWFFNEFLEMPTTLELLGNVKGKKILDFGCGSGIYAKLLTKKGAKVSGFDISEKMLAIARKENPKLDLRYGSGYNIPFKGRFDIVLASLTIHYLKDWDKVFQEVRRVLKKGGFFVFSTGNSVSEIMEKIVLNGKEYRVLGTKNYFKKYKIYASWKMNNKEVQVSAYHRPYEEIIRTIIKNGFEIADYKDAFPSKKGKKLFPDDYKTYSRRPFFCVWKVMKK